MTSAETETSVEQLLLVPRMVVGTLVGGLLIFAVVVWMITDRAETPADDQLILLVAGLILVAGVSLSWALGRLMVSRRRQRAPADEAETIRSYYEMILLRAAVIELPGFVCLIVYMTSGLTLALLGGGVAALLIAALFPTRAAFERFRAQVGGRGGDPGFEPR